MLVNPQNIKTSSAAWPKRLYGNEGSEKFREKVDRLFGHEVVLLSNWADGPRKAEAKGLVWLLLVQIIVSSECGDVRVGSVRGAVALFRVNADEIDAERCSRVKVMKYDAGGEAVTVYELSGKTRRDGRMSWAPEGNGLMTFHLLNLQKSDEGAYGCEVWRGRERVLTRNATLKVGGNVEGFHERLIHSKSLSDCTSLPAVTVAPNSPARLRCSLDAALDQRGPQNVSWVVVRGLQHAAVDSRRVEINGMSLTIRTASPGDGGWYRCHYVTGQARHCVDVRLNVQGAEETTTATTAPNAPTQTPQGLQQQSVIRRTVIAVVASAILVLVPVFLLGLLIYCRKQRRSNTTQRQIADAPREAETSYDVVMLSHLHDPDYDDSPYYCGNERLKTFNY